MQVGCSRNKLTAIEDALKLGTLRKEYTYKKHTLEKYARTNFLAEVDHSGILSGSLKSGWTGLDWTLLRKLVLQEHLSLVFADAVLDESNVW